MLTKWIRESVPVSDRARVACVAALRTAGISEAKSGSLADELIQLIQRSAIGVCEDHNWPTKAKIAGELRAALTHVREAENTVAQLSAPSQALLQDAAKKNYGPSLMGLTHLELAAETALAGIEQQITGKTGRIHLLLRSAALRWREASGVWPALSNGHEDGTATTPFLKILRTLLKEAIPKGREVPKISDHIFRRAVKEAMLSCERRDARLSESRGV